MTDMQICIGMYGIVVSHLMQRVDDVIAIIDKACADHNLHLHGTLEFHNRQTVVNKKSWIYSGMLDALARGLC